MIEETEARQNTPIDHKRKGNCRPNESNGNLQLVWFRFTLAMNKRSKKIKRVFLLSLQEAFQSK